MNKRPDTTPTTILSPEQIKALRLAVDMVCLTRGNDVSVLDFYELARLRRALHANNLSEVSLSYAQEPS